MLPRSLLLLPLALLLSCTEPCQTYAPDSHLPRGCSADRPFSVSVNDTCWSSELVTVTTGARRVLRAVRPFTLDTILLSLPPSGATAGSWIVPNSTSPCSECGEVEMRFADGRPPLSSRFGSRPGWMVVSWNSGGILEGTFSCSVASTGRISRASLDGGTFRIVEAQ